jgi:hypothetical protein
MFEGDGMNTMQWKWVGVGLIYLFILISGYWLSRSGKPFCPIGLNLHKLVALGCFVLWLVTIFKGQPLSSFKPVETAVVLMTVICFVVTIVSGGLLSIEKPMPKIIHWFHQILPYIAGFSSVSALYLLRIAL